MRLCWISSWVQRNHKGSYYWSRGVRVTGNVRREAEVRLMKSVEGVMSQGMLAACKDRQGKARILP